MNVIWRGSFCAIAALAYGCSTPPQKLPIPAQITCVFLSSPLSFTGNYGMLNVPWTTALAKGPYVSERTDADGTYYRAPPAGVSITGAPGSSYVGQSPPGIFSPMDGGFYIPNDPSKQPRTYRYVSTAAAQPDSDYNTADCSTTGYAKSATGTKMSLFPLAAAGAVGGAAGGLVGRSLAKGSSISYGQAAGVGAAGGAIAGLIIGAIVNADVGGIFFNLDIKDDRFAAELKRLVTTRVPLHETPESSAAVTSKSGSSR